MPATYETEKSSPSGLPIRSIPGDYGLPFFAPIRDRLAFYYSFPTHHAYFRSLVKKHASTVFRMNAPPGPFLAGDPRVVALLDANSFPLLFDDSKVEKRDVLTGTYVPSVALYGGFRVLAYLDPAEPRHAQLKHLVFGLLAARKSFFIPAFRAAYSALFDAVDSALASTGPAAFNPLNEAAALDFLCDAYFGRTPPPQLHKKAIKWLFFQLHPLTTLGLPKLVEELLLHSFGLPPFLVKSDYEALLAFFTDAGAAFLEEAKSSAGISRAEALNNLVFLVIFNAYGGFKLMFPRLMQRLAAAGPELHHRLAEEVRSVVGSHGGEVTAAGLEEMELTKSAVWEALRLDPPVEYQYGRAKADLVVESHDAAFRIKKGEMVFGFQPLVTRDERVFERAEEFVADRFVGDEGRKLLKYVLWSNGRETAAPAAGNKQCPGKDMVVMMGRLLVVEIFLRYDSFTAEVGALPLEPKITLTSVTKATATATARMVF